MIENQDYNSTEVLNSESEFLSCTFQNCLFTGIDLSGFTFDACHFIGCDFSMCKLHKTVLVNAKFDDCKLLGLDFGKCSKYIFSVAFRKCILNYSVFQKMTLRKTQFIQCVIHEAFFDEADLTQASFDGSDLEGTRFEHCNLTSSDFRNALGFVIFPQLNKLKGARFSYPGVLGLLSDAGIVVE